MDLIDSYTSKAQRRKSSRKFPQTQEVIFRLRDILFSVFSLLVLSPVFGLIAFFIKRDSPGPVFFRGKRAAKGEGAFSILKFRTMYENDRSYNGPKITAAGDTRITPVGKWLRDTKLNELPQLWNVLVGDMSLVGPRPEDPEIAAGWPEEIREEILSVRPGITSPASVLYRDEEAILSRDKVMDQYFKLVQPSKMRLDQLYVHHRSFLLDLDVFFWTFLVLLPRLGNFKPPEKLLFFGPVAKFARRYANWLIVDFIISFAAFGVSGVFWRTLGPIHLGLVYAVFLSFAFSLLFSLIGALFGIQKTVWSTASASEIVELALTAGFASCFALIINHNQLMPYQIIVLASLLALLGFVGVRYRARLFNGLARRVLVKRRVASKFRERVLIVGSGKAGEFAAWMMQNAPNPDRYQVIGFVDDDLLKQDVKMRGVKVLGDCVQIPTVVHEEDVGLILFAIHNIHSLKRDKILHLCNTTSAKVVLVPDVMGAIEDALHVSEPVKGGAFSTTGSKLSDMLSSLEESVTQGDIKVSLEQIEELKRHIENFQQNSEIG